MVPARVATEEGLDSPSAAVSTVCSVPPGRISTTVLKRLIAARIDALVPGPVKAKSSMPGRPVAAVWIGRAEPSCRMGMRISVPSWVLLTHTAPSCSFRPLAPRPPFGELLAAYPGRGGDRRRWVPPDDAEQRVSDVDEAVPLIECHAVGDAVGGQRDAAGRSGQVTGRFPAGPGLPVHSATSGFLCGRGRCRR